MKRILCMVCIFSMIISLCNVVAFAEDANIIVIKTGAEFNNNLIAANYGRTFRIEGTETLADGSTGIVLLGSQGSLAGFYGKIEGVDGKNNIQISKPLITSVGQADTSDVIIDNIVLKGTNADGTGAVSYSDNAGALINAAATNYDYTVAITNVTNYLDVTSTKAGKPAGGILGYVRYRKVTVKNCINKGKITSNVSDSTDAAAGGIVGRFYGDAKESAAIENCFNYGDITSSGCAAGIIGKGKAPAGSIQYCANFGTIKSTATTGTSVGAAGISFHYLTTRYCFNAGNVESASMAGGIWGTGLAKAELSDCFNLGEISSNNSNCYPSGIVGTYSATEAIVTNCYNLGNISGTNPVQIVDNKTATTDTKCINNYYVSDSDLPQVVGKKTTLEVLDNALPEGFSSDIWYNTESLRYKYSLPQIKGNEFTNNINDDWYIVAIVPGVAFVNTKSFSPEAVNDEEYNEYGSYSVVFTKFDLTAIEDSEITEFGMYLLDENGKYLATAPGKSGNRSNGIYGILFYGETFEKGKTYKAEPYIKVGETEYKGASVEFKIYEAE